MKKVFKIFYFLFTFHILSIAKFCQIKSWIYRHLSIIAKFKEKREREKKKLDPRHSLGIQCGERDLGSRGTLAPSSTFS